MKTMLSVASLFVPLLFASAPAAAQAPALDRALAGRLIALSVACADREWPNKPGHVYDGPASVRPPRELTPAFYGCFDWHSAVHGHWAMVRLLKRFPDLPEAPAARAILKRHLAPDVLAREQAFLAEDRNRTFERPYGLGWLLRLALELRTWDDPDGRELAAAIAPLARFAAGRLADYLPRLTVPIRDGTHASTAFSLVHALDWARTAGDATFAALLERRARDFYGADTDCPTAYEPSGEDFVSPCLAEADVMRRMLPAPEFRAWLARFLPPLDSPRFAPVRAPLDVKDPQDPRIGHLIGLAFQRAWSFRGIASALAPGDPRRAVLRDLADVHARDALARMTASGYGGEHWLASFAVFLFTDAGGAE